MSVDARAPGAFQRHRDLLVGSVLVAVTVVAALVCLLMLSCTLTQTRMSMIAFSGVNVSIWKLDDIRKQWTTLRDQIGAQVTTLAAAEKQKSEVNADYATFDLTYRPMRTTLDAKLNALLVRLKTLDPQLATDMQGLGPVERIETLASQRAAVVAAHPEIEGDLKAVMALGDDYRRIDAKRIALTAEIASRKEIAQNASDNLNALQGALNDLFSVQFGVKPIDAATRARIENALFELYSGGMLGELIHSMLVQSPEIVTLFLVVAMGVLGSSLQLTHQLFIRGEVERFGVYALRICVGAITALVIFIVAKAGVPVVADASRLGGDMPINPYLIAFLAIISGLMSEQAIASVEVQATKYFGGGTADKPRYARASLATAVAAAKRDRAALAAALGVTAKTFDAWLSGEEPVPLAAQQTLAAVLDAPLRDLFSDLPATTRAATTSDEGDAAQLQTGFAVHT